MDLISKTIKTKGIRLFEYTNSSFENDLRQRNLMYATTE